MSFGENLIYCRKQQKITQEELAERLGVSRQTISRWETDSVFPDIETVIRLCEMFDCNMDTLVRGDVQKEKNADKPAHSSSKRKGERINDACCSSIMITALLVFLLCGFLGGWWHPAWVAFPTGALICGICSSIIDSVFDKDDNNT